MGTGTNRGIAKQYGVNHQAVQRHREHIPELLVKSATNLDAFGIDSILMKIENNEKETLDIIEALKTDEERDYELLLKAIAQQRGNIELVAKVMQLIDKAPQVHVHISEQAYQAIVDALEDQPEAQFAVVDALAPLAELESGEGP